MQQLTKQRDDALENLTKVQEENQVLKTQVSTCNVMGWRLCMCLFINFLGLIVDISILNNSRGYMHPHA